MNAFSFGSAARGGLDSNSDEPKPDKPLDAAWIVLEAANDLRDDATVEACRRVIDANLKGVPAAPADEYIVQHYFR
jgi:predicted nucleotidyltransferase